MKIAMVTPYYYPKVGGLESYVRHLSLNLKNKANQEIIIITTNHEEPIDKIQVIDGIKTHRLKILFKLSNTPIHPLWWIKLYKVLKSEKPDIINVHTPVPFIADVASIVAKQLKIPCVVTYHAGGFKKNQFISDFITTIYSNTFEKLLLQNARKIIALNEFVKDVTFRNYKKKVILIMPGITLHSETSSINNSNKNTLLFVGNLDKTHSWKGLEFLLFAVQNILIKFPDMNLRVVGGGDNLAYYQELAQKLDITRHVAFYGSQNSRQVESHYKSSGILVLPSYSEAESLGLVLLEAMSFGLPIVASDIGGIPFSIKDGVNGYLCTPKDAVSLQHAIERVLSSDAIYKKFSENNIEAVKKYSWDNHTKELLTVFQSTLNNNE